MTRLEQSEDCQMPGCERHTEVFADLCNPCAAAVAELADAIGEPADLTASPLFTTARDDAILATVDAIIGAIEDTSVRTVDDVRTFLRVFRAELARPQD